MSKPKTVTARYLGGTDVAFPHLADVDRNTEAYEEWVAGGSEGVNPRCLVVHGDEFPVDEASAEGREDLEVVQERSGTRGKAKPAADTATTEED